MTQQPMQSKSQLLEALRSSEQEVISKLGAIPPEEFESGRYEGGWNGREILAHVASMEWTYRRVIDLAREGPPAKPEEKKPKPDSGGSTRLDVNDYNRRQVERRANATVPELLEEFRTNRAGTIAAVEEADEDLFGKPVRSAGGLRGPLATVLYGLAVLHAIGHVNDIAGS